MLKSYKRFVKGAYDEYIKPTLKYSDIIVPRGKENHIAIDLIVVTGWDQLGLLVKTNETLDNIVECKAKEVDKIIEKLMNRVLNMSDMSNQSLNLLFLTRSTFWHLFKSQSIFRIINTHLAIQ